MAIVPSALEFLFSDFDISIVFPSSRHTTFVVFINNIS